MPESSRVNPNPPEPTTVLAALWPQVAAQEVVVARSVAAQLRPAAGRCGIYVLSFADGECYVGQAVNVVSRFGTHRKTDRDIAGLRFWRFRRDELDAAERSAIHALRKAGVLLRNVADAGGRLGASDLDTVVGPADQQRWLASEPVEAFGDDERADRPHQRVSGRARFSRLAADPRFEALLPAVRRYLGRTMPYPRRTEFFRWSVSAGPDTDRTIGPRLFTVTVHSLETLFGYAPAGQPHRTLLRINVDLATMQRRWGEDLAGLDREFGAACHEVAAYRVRPGVLGLEVDGARNLMRLLDVDGVVGAARRLNLDMMREGPALQWRSHCFSLADRLLEPVTETTGDDLQLGLVCDVRGDLPLAESHYRRAALGGDGEAAFRLGELCSERDDHEQAEEWYRRAADAGYHGVRRSPDFSRTHALTDRARAYESDGLLEKAAACYRRAAEAGDTSAYPRLGDVLAELGDLDLAAAAYRNAAGTGHPGGWYGLAVLHRDRGDEREAQGCFQRAADGGHPGALVQIGQLQQGRGELEAAESTYRQAVRAGDRDAVIRLGDLFAERGATGQAAAWYRRAINRGNAEGLLGLGALHESGGDLAEAQTCYRQAVDLGHTPGLIDLGRVLGEQGDHVQAGDCWREAVAAGHTEAHLHLGDLLFTDDVREAQRHYRLAADAGHARGWHGLALVHRDRGAEQAAESCFRRAVELGCTGALIDFGRLLAERGDAARAQRCLLDAAAAGHAEAHLDLGDLARARSDQDAAEHHYRLAAAGGQMAAVTRLGTLFLSLGEFDAAEPLLRAMPGDPVAQDALRLLLSCRAAEAAVERVPVAGLWTVGEQAGRVAPVAG